MEEAKIEQVGNPYDTDSFGGNPQRGRVYSDNGLAPGLQTMQGGGLEPKVVLGWTRDSKGKVVNRHPVEVANCVTAAERDNTQNYVCCAMRGRGESGNTEQRIEPRKDNLTNTITTVQKDNLVSSNIRIRKLTPRECFRLMGVDDTDIDTIQAAGISNSQQYKMAGNSIVVDVLYYIFANMFLTEEDRALL